MNNKRSRMPAVCALVVGAAEPDQAKLEAVFQTSGWKLGWARTRQEARAFLASTSVRVVIAESELEEGGWRQMLEDINQNPDPPVLVVTARLADESLWAEVLNMGGYDVLAKPLDSEEITRVVGAAVRRFDNERCRPQPRSNKPMVMAAAALARAAEVA